LLEPDRHQAFSTTHYTQSVLGAARGRSGAVHVDVQVFEADVLVSDGLIKLDFDFAVTAVVAWLIVERKSGVEDDGVPSACDGAVGVLFRDDGIGTGEDAG
jgi:hypothetical protein